MEYSELPIQLSENSYSLFVGNQITSALLKEQLARFKETEVFVVTNDLVQNLYPDFIQSILPVGYQCHQHILQDGEEFKTLQTVSNIYDFLMAKKASRKSILIAFGGGVIGDITGFVAATFKRGIPYIQIPTTLLSQVDSSIGGKTGVNHPSAKNSIGAFKQPIASIIDSHFLNTLPEREFLAGYGELLKHALIRDGELFNELEDISIDEIREDQPRLQNLIYRSCRVKAKVVEEDEKEASLRAILNFGHTLGHFLETFTGYTNYLHGECVLAGIEFAAWWSLEAGLIESQEFSRVEGHLKKLSFKMKINPVDKQAFMEILENDKRTSAKGMTFVALEGIGKVKLIPGISIESLWESFQKYILEARNTLSISIP